MRRFLFGAAGAWGQSAPASPFRPLRSRVMSFVRPKCGLTPRPAPQLPLSEGSVSQLNPDTSVSYRDGEVPYIR